MRGYPGNKSTYIILLKIELYVSICRCIYDLIYSITLLTSHLRQTDPLLLFYPEQTVPGGEAGRDIRLLQTWLVQDFISMGFFASPSSLKSLQQQQLADRGNGWLSFQRAASTCLIIQGHFEPINKATLMYGEEDNMCVCVCPKGREVGYADTHLHRVRQFVISVLESDTRCQWNAAQGWVCA